MTLATATKGVFDANFTNADIIFLFAFIGLMVIGIIMVVQKAMLTGLALIATALIPLGLMFVTP
jgi:hypothetical membrane protein